MKKVLALLTFLSFLLIGCEKDGSPEQSLKSYIDYRFSSNQSKERVLEWTADPLQSKLAEMSEEDFERFLDNDKYTVKSLRIVSTNCSTKELCYITYILKYDTAGEDNSRMFTSEIKKIAELRKIKESWKISDINNIKTFHDSHKDIEP